MQVNVSIRLVKIIPTHALFIKTLIVLKKQALHMFRPANWPSSGATSVSQHNHVQYVYREACGCYIIFF
jgi:hypothetical protein